MKILLAPDKFKGSLSAQDICKSLSEGIQETCPGADIIVKPLADGGDGSLMVLAHYFTLKTIQKIVLDPLNRPLMASYKLADKKAYIELSVASGLTLLEPEDRNCMYTSSYGTGELILDALKKGANQIFLFIGGSATNDGGTGIARALGYRFYDKRNNALPTTGIHLTKIDRIDSQQLLFKPGEISVQVICDVSNPFYGKNGAAYVFAPQKGASPDEVIHLDKGLQNLARKLSEQGYPDISNVPGAGAAGGIGGGMIAFLGAELQSGIQTFMEITHLESVLKDCDLIITGEGKLDIQTEQGKVISGVCELATKHNKKVIAVCGAIDQPIPASLGISEYYTVLSRSASLEEAMNCTKEKLIEIGREIGQTL